jgi:hypothetical protein
MKRREFVPQLGRYGLAGRFVIVEMNDATRAQGYAVDCRVGAVGRPWLHWRHSRWLAVGAHRALARALRLRLNDGRSGEITVMKFGVAALGVGGNYPRVSHHRLCRYSASRGLVRRCVMELGLKAKK